MPVDDLLSLGGSDEAKNASQDSSTETNTSSSQSFSDQANQQEQSAQQQMPPPMQNQQPPQQSSDFPSYEEYSNQTNQQDQQQNSDQPGSQPINEQPPMQEQMSSPPPQAPMQSQRSNQLDNLPHSYSERLHLRPTDHFDGNRVKIFLIKLLKAAKRHESRVGARGEYHEHVSAIQKYVPEKKREEAQKHLHELHQKVDRLVQTETSYPEHAKLQAAHDRIEKLEKQIGHLMASKAQKDEYFERIEKKINRKLSADKEIVRELEQKLHALQFRLKSAPSKKTKQYSDLKKRVELTRTAIQKMKKANQ